MKHVLVYEYEPGNCVPRVFGPYDEVADAFAEVAHYFPKAELCFPTHANMADDVGLPEALISVIPLERLMDHVQDLHRQLYPDDVE